MFKALRPKRLITPVNIILQKRGINHQRDNGQFLHPLMNCLVIKILTKFSVNRRRQRLLLLFGKQADQKRSKQRERNGTIYY